jgi:hypothetical protein
MASLKPLLKDPDGGVREALAQRLDLSPEFYEVLAHDLSVTVRRRVASNSAVPASALEVLASDDDPAIKEDLSTNTRLPQDFLKTGQSSNAWLLSEYRLLSPTAALEISKSPNANIRAALAANRLLPSKLLRLLSKDHDPSVRSGVARNPACPMELLLFLAKDPEPIVQSAALETHRLPDPIAIDLMGRQSEVLFRKGYVTVQCSTGLLEFLAKDKDASVRQIVADQNNLPPDIVAGFLNDEDPAIRSLAQIHRLTWEQWQQAARDTDFFVSQRARLRLREAQEIYKQLDDTDSEIQRASQDSTALGNFPPFIRAKVALEANVSTTAGIWVALSKDPDASVRKALAANPNVPVPLLESLAKDIDSDVDGAALGNPRANSAVVTAAGGRLHDSAAAWALAADPRTSGENLAALFVVSQNPDIKKALARRKEIEPALDALADTSDVNIRRNIAMFAGDSAVLLKLAADDDPTVRWSVAYNVSDTAAVYEMLANDANIDVRRISTENTGMPLSLLQKLSLDPVGSVSFAAKAALAKREANEHPQ